MAVLPPLPIVAKVRLRMPYADENPDDDSSEPRKGLGEPNPLVPPPCGCEDEDGSIWKSLIELVRGILPVPPPGEQADETPSKEAPAESPDSATMPDMMDYHQGHCPYQHGCPRGCPFPGPAHQFDRPAPTSTPPE